MVRSAIQVVIRTRPVAQFAHDAIRIDAAAGVVAVHLDRQQDDKADAAPNHQLQDWTFRFSGILHNASQETVFDRVGRDMVLSVLNGFNGTLMAYGQTGAGKTFTMGNGTYDYQYRGVAPRAISLIFRSIAARPESEITVRISYLEIYNEQLVDLLADDDNHDDLSIRDDGAGNVAVKNLITAVVASEEQALNLLFVGDANRATGEHAHNRVSSRSHTIFTIYLETRSRVESAEKVVASKLNVVDLAGSERVAKTDSRGATLQEALYINRSLSFLEQVVIALSNRHRDHVPFRSSKLTHVLRNSLGGNSITRLIANIWPEAVHLDETISTLKFATRMMRVTTEATVSVELDPSLLLRKYKREVARLKQELALHDMLSNRGPISYGEVTTDQREALSRDIERYLSDQTDNIEIVSVSQVQELCRQFKRMILDSRSLTHSPPPPPPPPPTEPSSDQPLPIAATTTATTTKFVGDLVENGFSVGGSARPDARPVVVDQDDNQYRIPSPDRMSTTTPIIPEKDVVVTADADDDEAFQRWRSKEGATIDDEHQKVSSMVRESRARLKSAGVAVNVAKREIDGLTMKLEGIRRGRRPTTMNDDGDEIIIDEEEFEVMRALRRQKESYQRAFESWEQQRGELSLLRERAQTTKTRMASLFLQSDRGGVAYHDVLDDEEHLDKLETDRILSTDPDSLSYHNAKKAFLRSASAKKKGPKRWGVR